MHRTDGAASNTVVRRDVATASGIAWRANEFAVPRMEPGKQRPDRVDGGGTRLGAAASSARSRRDAIRGDRRCDRRKTATSHRRTSPSFLDAYMERCVKPAGLRSIGSVRSRVAVLKEHLGELPLTALEEPDEINRFKTDSDYAEEVEIATVHRVLETLRAAMNWGMAQTPPLFDKSPFHRFGVRMNKKRRRRATAGCHATKRSGCSTRRSRR